MKKKIIIILAIIICQLSIVNSFAQSISRNVVSSAGGTLTGGSNSISFNIGQPVFSSLSSGSNMITQGFEQPGEELHTGTVLAPVCAGSIINVPYSAIDIGGGNVFTIQLSDAAGNFANAVNIGTQTGNASGTISSTIPGGIPAGTAHPIRVISSFPGLNGTDNGTDIPIAAVALHSVIDNACHGGNNGRIEVACVACPATGNSFTIVGPTINTTGETSGIFTGLTAGLYTITMLTQDGCSSSTTATVTEPPGTQPDISLGSDYSSNIFIAAGTETNIVFNVSEIAGNASTGDTIRIIKPSGYDLIYNETETSAVIGSTTYLLDNNRWKLVNTGPVSVSLILDPAHNGTAGTLNCGERAFVSIRLKRITLNISTFSLSARMRRSNGEINVGNNLNSIVFIAE